MGVLVLFFFLSMRRKWFAPRRDGRKKKKHRGGQRGCLIVFGLYAVFFHWPRNCPADSNLIRHPQIKHGSSSSKQKRSNTALPNKQSALYFHLFLSFIYIIFFIYFILFSSSCLAIWNGNRLAGRYVKAKEMSEAKGRERRARHLSEGNFAKKLIPVVKILRQKSRIGLSWQTGFFCFFLAYWSFKASFMTRLGHGNKQYVCDYSIAAKSITE